MWTVAQDNLVLIAIALVIGLAVGFWLFRGRRGTRVSLSDTGPVASAQVPRPAPRHLDGPEGNGLPDEFASATRDVAGEILGVKARAQVDGPSGPPDNLQLLKGCGPKLAAQLNQNGITRFEQLARLSGNEVAILDERMGAFRGRIARDRLVEQAAYLERGDTEGFEAVFGRLGG